MVIAAEIPIDLLLDISPFAVSNDLKNFFIL